MNVEGFGLWTFARAALRVVLLIAFVWPMIDRKRRFARILAGAATVILFAMVRAHPFFSGSTAMAFFLRQVMQTVGACLALLLMSTGQKLFSVYVACVFSFATGIWKSIVSPYYWQEEAYSLFSLIHTGVLSALEGTCGEFLLHAGILLLIRSFFRMQPDRHMQGSQAALVLFPILMNWSVFSIFDSLLYNQALLPAQTRSTVAAVLILLQASALFLIAMAEQYFFSVRRSEEAEIERHLLSDACVRMEALRQSDEALRVLRHDMQNHLSTLMTMNQTGEDAAGYIDALIAEIAGSAQSFDSGNSTVDCVLAQKNDVCRRAGIRLEAYVRFKDMEFLKPTEACVLFANCLDNCIEAVASLPEEERRIVVSCAGIGGCMVAKFSNPCKGVRECENGLPKTTKADGSGHGYGLKSVEMILRRHAGTLLVGQRDGVFTVTWMIPMKEMD